MNCKPYIRAHADELLESLAALVHNTDIEGVPEEHAPFGREPARALHGLRSAKSWASGRQYGRPRRLA
ncbi:MAG: hypothetical protein ACLUAY_06555 [Butyricicoccus sp.]